MLIFISLLLILPSSLALSSIIHEKRAVPLRNAIDRQRVHPDTFLPMRIGLAQNEKALSQSEAWLMDVADPQSSNFGRHWSQDDVIQAFKPSDESLRAVTDWLAQHGINKFVHTDNQQWLAFDLPARKAEELLQTQFFEHQTPKGKFEVSCDEYSLPQSLQKHVDFITPGVKSRDITGRSDRSKEYMRATKRNLPPQPKSPRNSLYERGSKPSASSSSSSAPSSSSQPASPSSSSVPPYPPNGLRHCHDSVTPACIRAMYNFEAADPNKPVSKNNSMGIYESGSNTRQGDLNKFFQDYTDIPSGVAPIFDSIDGAITHPNQTKGWRKTYTDGEGWSGILVESTLDLELSFPIVYPQTVTVFQTDDWYYSQNRLGFNTFLDAIDGSYCTYTAFNETGDNPHYDPVYPDPRPHGYKGKLECGVFKPTNVISMSYSGSETVDPESYQKRQCLEFLKLALQGTSTFVSSGDDGVGPCYGDRHDGDQPFDPSFPPTCPWVTAVGATHIYKDNTVYAQERAVPHWSGGGFSNWFDTPSYQKEAVETYFKTANLSLPFYYNGKYQNSTGRYNRNGRGYPDISAVGESVATIIQQEYQSWGGTSASSPIVASIFNRIIEERIRAGKGPLGLINPTLYKNGAALNDILIGDNHGHCSAGFKCAAGWDPVTGLGTPNYPKLLDVFLNLP